MALAVSLGAAQQVAASGFIDDSKATLDLRNFYYNQDTRNAKAPTDKEWGQAFMFNYQSGFTEGLVGFGLDLQAMYGLRLDASGARARLVKTTPPAVFSRCPMARPPTTSARPAPPARCVSPRLSSKPAR